jgi:protein TonB
MSRDLFGEVSDPRVRMAPRSQYTVPISLAVHTVGLVILAVVPMLGEAVPPDLPVTRIVFSEPPPPPSPPPAPRVRTDREPPQANPAAAPVVAPDSIRPETGRQRGFVVPEGPDVGIVGIVGALEVAVVAPATTPPPPPPPQAPVRVGDRVQPPAKLRHVAPVYPAIAQAARVQGTVIVDAIISTSGRVESVRVLRSVPLLDEAAASAVREWVFTPTLLNGVPVPVVMTVTVTFRLPWPA